MPETSATVRKVGSSAERRRNGFALPLHPLQVVSWVVASLDVSVFVVFALPLLAPTSFKVATSVLFVSSVVTMVVGAARATWRDPCDPNVTYEEPATLPGRSEDSSAMEEFCSYCNVNVFVRSKHCRECNKCVQAFDHHCMWLNNCIGKNNYRDFLMAIVGVACMVGLMLISACVLVADYASTEERLAVRMKDTSGFEEVSKEFVLALVLILSLVNLPLFLLDVQLIFLHCFLTWQGLTTYEYILVKSGRLQPASGLNPTERAKAAMSGASRLVGRKIKTLPACLDWIVFARCCKGRKKRHGRGRKDATVRPVPEEGEECQKDPEAGLLKPPKDQQKPQQPEAQQRAQQKPCLGMPVKDSAENASQQQPEGAPRIEIVSGRPTNALELTSIARDEVMGPEIGLPLDRKCSTNDCLEGSTSASTTATTAFTATSALPAATSSTTATAAATIARPRPAMPILASSDTVSSMASAAATTTGGNTPKHHPQLPQEDGGSSLAAALQQQQQQQQQKQQQQKQQEDPCDAEFVRPEPADLVVGEVDDCESYPFGEDTIKPSSSLGASEDIAASPAPAPAPSPATTATARSKHRSGSSHGRRSKKSRRSQHTPNAEASPSPLSSRPPSLDLNDTNIVDPE